MLVINCYLEHSKAKKTWPDKSGPKNGFQGLRNVNKKSAAIQKIHNTNIIK